MELCIARLRNTQAAVMNFITASYAYCLYGWETLDCGLTMYTQPYHKRVRDVKAKYERRGWDLVNASQAADLEVFVPLHRSVGDTYTWIIKLGGSGSHWIDEEDKDVKSWDDELREVHWALAYTSCGRPFVALDHPSITTFVPMI